MKTNYSFVNLSEKYYKKYDLSYYKERIFDIETCLCVRKFIYDNPSITIRGTLDPVKYPEFMFGGWNRKISKKYLRLFS